MIVYRVCHIDELDNLIKGRFEELGKEYNREIMKDTNTHMYHDGVKYLHFFERLESIMYLRRVSGFYLCYYDIPEDLLDKGKGEGYYVKLDTMDRLVNVSEFAIPTSDLSMNNLIKIDRINSRIDLDDYIEDPDLTRFMQEMYTVDKDKKLVKVL